MAVTPGYVGSNLITWSASTTATVSSASIGTATWDRLVVVGITVEETATINTVTIGGITATSAISVRNTTGTPDNAVAIFYARVPTGTTGNIVVTLSASSSQTGVVSVWAMTGASTPPINTNSGQGAGATQTLAGITIPTGGAAVYAFNNATTGTAVTWTNATERDDLANSGATYRHSSADTTTAGTPTVTADGATANQILAGASFAPFPAGAGVDLTPYVEKAPSKPRTAAIALMASGLVMCPQPVVQVPDANTADTRTRQSADITTGRRGTRTLHYQSWVRPPAPPVAAPVTPTFGWHQPLSIAASAKQRRPAPRLTYVALVLEPIPVEARGGAAVGTSHPRSRTLFYQSKIEPVPQAPAAAVVVATVEWIPPLSTMPPSRFVVRPQPQFVPPVAAQVTADEWLQPFQRQVPGPFPVHSQPVLAYPPAAPPTADEWLTPFVRAVARPRVANALHTPFVPKEVVAENTVTPDNWMQPFYKAAPATKLNVSNVTYPYFAPVATNSRTEWDWYVQWKEPPRYWWQGRPFQPFIPREAVIDNTVTPDNWLQAFRGAPRVLQRLPGGTPFVPKEVVQDVHGPEKWLQAFRGPPRYWPVKVQQTPFIPRIAVIDNTVTPDNWLFRFQGAVPRPPVRVTQPFFGYPYESQPNLTTSIEWLQKWQGPPRYTPRKSYPYQPFIPRIAVIDNTVTPDKWLRGFDRARPARPIARPAIAWNYQPVLVDNTVRIDKWQQPLSRAVRIPRVARPTQPAGFLQPPTVFLQSVSCQITVRFERVRRTVCRTQTDDGSVTQAEQGDVWVTQDEAPGDCNSAFEFVAFEEDAFQSCEVISFEVTEQSDQWTTQAETDDPWSEQQQEPGSSCCDED